MRTTVVVVIALVLGCLFLAQKHHERVSATQQAAKQAAAPAATTPRPVSEHNWAKHALDTTRKVTDKVAEQRKAEGVRK